MPASRPAYWHAASSQWIPVYLDKKIPPYWDVLSGFVNGCLASQKQSSTNITVDASDRSCQMTHDIAKAILCAPGGYNPDIYPSSVKAYRGDTEIGTFGTQVRGLGAGSTVYAVTYTPNLSNGKTPMNSSIMCGMCSKRIIHFS